MVKNLKRFRKQVEREQGRLEALKCDFFPTTYVLPVCALMTFFIKII
jgi:tubulin polyglutamylase TTLL9